MFYKASYNGSHFVASVALPVKPMHGSSSSSQSQLEQWGPVSFSLFYGGAAFAVKQWIFYFLFSVSWLENLDVTAVFFTCFS